ncbi:hypothetical protein EGI16_19880 [Chryseobacterium sp. G0240]|uniref:hypothetical protein n=1 Tax=Chryseobacterium sp. G0240 TaxID=2487066 RepID=UPI000F44C5A4|nr:hypothetical protein [Chryseobacterium sp. G0240]ROH98825.1 hypothetical protein EGI16_19880 [Chryseobacterium sp. G0240]
MYTEIEQQTLDIDWFFTDGKYIGFVASGAGKLPKTVANSVKNNKKLVSYFRNLPQISDAIVSPLLDNLLTKIFGSGVDEKYLRDFISLTQKGLYSFDKTNLNDFMDNHYHLVTIPKNPLKISDLPPDILNFLELTQYHGEMEAITHLDVGKII